MIAVEDFLRVLVKAEKGELDDMTDSLMHDPHTFNYSIDYIIRTWLDHRKHGTYPETGGYNDQDPLLMDDWHTMNLYHMRVENNVFSQMQMPTNAPDISDLMGG